MQDLQLQKEFSRLTNKICLTFLLRVLGNHVHILNQRIFLEESVITNLQKTQRFNT